MESDIDIIIETYMLFVKFDISVPAEDYDQAYSLRMNFEQMIEHSKELSLDIFNMQNELFSKLSSGIVRFQNDLLDFNDDFEKEGPMEAGISAKEASDRVC